MISRSGKHAIRALALLARLPEGEFTGATALASEIGAPGNYLGKLLQTLARAGLVESRKGLGGGFRLARDPASIPLLDILDPIEQIRRWQGCFLGLPICSDDAPCAVHERWGRLREDCLSLLSHTTLADIVAHGVDCPRTSSGGDATAPSAIREEMHG